MSIPESELSYGSILTLTGENAEINGKLNNKPINFTHIAIGDANDVYVQPSRTQTTLVNEITRIPVTGMEKITPSEPDGVPQLKVWAKIPDDIVDVAVREFAAVATFDGNSYLHAVGNSVRIPILSGSNNGGEVNDIFIEMTFAVTSLEPIVMIDPTIVTATRKYVDDQNAKKVNKSGDEMLGPLKLPYLEALDSYSFIKGLHLPNWGGGDSGVSIIANGGVCTFVVSRTDNPTGTPQPDETTDLAVFYKGALRKAYHEGFKPSPSDIGTLTEQEINSRLLLNIPVGVPISWPGTTPPTGWLECRGQSFNPVTYPELAKAYPDGVIDDLRGEFIRGWDNGRGVDSGRVIRSYQKASLILGNDDADDAVWGGFKNAGNRKDMLGWEPADFSGVSNENLAQWIGPQTGQSPITSSLGRIGTGSVRPRNKAYMYIVRAA